MNQKYTAYSRPVPGYPEAYYPAYRSATPSPAASPPGAYNGYYSSPTPRPGTARPVHRAHNRHGSNGFGWDRYEPSGEPWDNPLRGAFSPRYNSSGYYATAAANVSRKCSWSTPQPTRPHSSFYHRASYGDSEDEDEGDHVERGAWDRGQYQQYRPRQSAYHRGYNFGWHGTDPNYSFQAPPVYPREDLGSSPQYNDTPPRYSRRQSNPPPKRSQTARPATMPKKPQNTALATEADARKHRIPQGYSLKHWDPSEEPIILLGSVFDCNSLGKWIYDWTVYYHGASAPIADIAGELWLLLIQLAGKVRRAEECMPSIRTMDHKEMVDDFIGSGERLNDKFKKLLKTCETPMLKVCKTHKGIPLLGKTSGIEFVNAMFGRDRELDATEKFMSSVRLWNLRFDANCEEILRHPEL